MAARQKDIELILLRQWASYLAMPIWIMGEDGSLLYYNEPAEAILGLRFDESGEMPLAELSRIFETRTADDAPVAAEDLPIGVALIQRRPAHRRIRVRALDGQWRTIDITAFPIEGQSGRHLGAMAIFWEANDG